ncbi:hypothetical protein TREMEDRAFT_56000, partial [Tremella mesenterica DSM 1558]|uniref:uncharacterized protein n=1 Tax=Tremella mesenterica (strain ATCC 24925 / CBS 8224 / DSM 1558 / NBRC 9311 / NRRL Y-6157 / RJB 2259-6 / UBC 559-6) TaxID=578456 RepID=UPI0003F49D16
MAHPYYGDPTGGLANGNSRPSAPSTPGAAATTRSEPSSFQFDPPLFDFSLPSIPTTIPPRLAQIGRRLSEMSDQLLPVSPSYSEIELARSKSSRTIRSREEVPGMGDEPIMCPFCQKPLPPSLFVSHTGPHSHVPKRTPVKRTVSMMDANVGSRTPSQMRKSLDVLEKGGGVTEGQLAGSGSQTSPSNEKGVQRSQAVVQGKADPSEVKATAKATSVTPAIAKTPSVLTATS